MARRSKKILKSRIRNILIVLAIAICLFVIYKFNFSTKSEVTPKTPVKFKEFGSEKSLTEDLEIFEDENGKYIVLPEKVSGYFADKYYLESENILSDKKEEDSNTVNSNTSSENTVSNNNTTSDNTNSIANTNTSNGNTSGNIVADNTVKNNNTAVDNTISNSASGNTNTVKDTNKNTQNTVKEESKVVKEVAKTADENKSLFEQAVAQVAENSDNSTSDINNGNSSQDNNTDNKNDNNSSSDNNNDGNKNDTSNDIKDDSTDNSQSGTNNDQNVDNTEEPQVPQAPEVPQMPDQSNPEDQNKVQIPENKEDEEKNNKREYNAGDKIYVDEDALKSQETSIEVEFQTMDVGGLKLYNQELVSESGSSTIKVTGYMPFAYYLDIKAEDPNKIEELKSDVEELVNSSVLLAYDIKITDGETEFQPKDYYQSVTVSITSETELADKITGNPVEILHIVDNQEKDEIVFEKINVSNKTTDTVECITNEFSTYAVIVLDAYTDTTITAYNYDSDYNYYIGRNHTNEFSQTDKKTYTDENLAKVTVNYYSYDYSKNLNEEKVLNVTNYNWSVGNYTNQGNQRTYPVIITLTTNNNQYIDPKKGWQMSFDMPTQFLPAETQNANNGKLNSISFANGTATISGNNLSGWTKNSAYSYQTTLQLKFDTRTNNNININSVNNFKFAGIERNLVGYISAEADERQTLFTYVLCVPIENGKISFELIDNPYMDRPADFGFDGWTSNESYSFALNNETKVQTLTMDAAKDVTINLYPNWKEANIVFVDGTSGNDNNTGKFDSPYRTWTGITKGINGNHKTAQASSDRELNIVVLKNGRLTDIDTRNINYGYTITSLYDGVDYRSNSTNLNITSSATINYDLQIDFVNITGPSYYTAYNNATGNIRTYIVGNCHNLRFGRGMMPLDTSRNRSTFDQVQGGYGDNASSYRTVVETGKYNNIQVERGTGVKDHQTNAVLVLGCDYDRIKNVNTNMYVYNRVASRTNSGTITSADKNKPVYTIIAKSGTMGMDYFNTRDTDYPYAGIYVGGHGYAGNDVGERTIIVEGGNIANIIGGLATSNGTTSKTCIYVKGGSVQNIVGGAGRSTTYGDRMIQVTGGKIAYSVSGGSNGYESNNNGDNGKLTGNTLVYIGGDAEIGTENESNSLYDVYAGCVLGAGNGKATVNTAGEVNTSHIIIDGNAKINNSVYGGGNFGVVRPTDNGNGGDSGIDLVEFSDETKNIEVGETYILANGTGNNSYAISDSNNDDVSSVRLSTKNIPDPSEEWIVEEAGNNYVLRNAQTGKYLQVVEVTDWFWSNYYLQSVNNRKGLSHQASGNGIILYSDEYNRYIRYNNSDWGLTNRENNATPIHFLKYKTLDIPEEPEDPEEKASATIEVLGGNIKNNVYGGSNQNSIYGNTKITMKDGTVNGAIYGGSNTKGTIQEEATINIQGGTVGTVGTASDVIFGGGQGNGTIVQKDTRINISDKFNNTQIYGNIYGGSALGNVNGNSIINIKDDLSTDKSILINGNVFGGGKGETRDPANTAGSATVTVDGGTYSSMKVFGGCNVNGDINGKILVNIGEKNSTTVDEVYGAGNEAQVSTNTDSVYVYLYKNAIVNKAFNGGNKAGIDGDNASHPRGIYVKGATVTDSVYGASNISGTMNETHVYCSDGAQIGNVYGSGYGSDSRVTGNTNVQITSIDETTGTKNDPVTTVLGNVFGGGDLATVGSYTNVDIISAKVNGTVFGGGDNVEVETGSNVNVSDSTIGTIFGGGNLGNIGRNTTTATTKIDVNNNSNITTIYGGGRSAAVLGYTNVTIEDSIVNDVYGGGQGTDATVSRDTSVTLIGTNSKANITNNVYGGGDQGKVTGNTLITATNTDIANTIYGGGNRADIDGNTSVAITENSTSQFIYGGGNEGKVGGTTAVSATDSTISDTIYGGGNKGEVSKNTIVTIDNSKIANSIFGGGKAANVNGTQVTLQNNATTTNVYGGGDQGEVIETTNLIIDSSSLTRNAYGGGNGATSIENPGTIPGKVGKDTNVTIRNKTTIGDGSTETDKNGEEIYLGNVYGGGKGITALVSGNTNVSLNNSEVKADIYGGGDNGSVAGSTNVEVTNANINGNAYAAGNGENAVVDGNSYICVEGTTNIGKNLFGGGNAAQTGDPDVNNSLAIVDLAGGTIGKNVYGGANSSVINGNTVTNIGVEAINSYHKENKNYKIGTIDIGGTVFGGGESMDPSKDFDYDSISVTGTILINVNGDKYDHDGTTYTLNIAESIFGSGNASSANTDGDIYIRNYGSANNPKQGVSIQRASNVVVDNSALWLRGTTDSTSVHPDTYFTLNIIGALTVKNNTTLYLRNGANLLKNFYSKVGEDGNEEFATVTIEDEVIKSRNVDNRVYMYSGINLNISPSETLETYGEVKGMTFFGIYKNSSTESGENENPDDLSGLYTGMYGKDYQIGEKIKWEDRDFTRCYAVGMHQKSPEQDITKDGFYTAFERLDEELDPGDILTEDNYSATSYIDYIKPTPEDDIYYMWYAGPDVEVYYYSFNLFASKYSTLGTKELSLLGISYKNAQLKIHSVDSSLIDGVGLYDKNEIPNVNENQDEANSKLGLAMKTGNNGWSMNGVTNFYSTDNNATYNGDTTYTIENSTVTPSLSFYLYHSNNITEDRDLGYYTITMDLAYWKDDLNQGRATVILDIALATMVYDDFGYNGAITPGRQYDLFTSTETNVTTKSSFSTFFELAEPKFSENEKVKQFYDNSYRVISTEYVLPENTTITMIDRYDNNNPTYYYYTITADDVANNKSEFKLSEFKVMGSTDEMYDEKAMREKYYLENLDYEYECFIFTVDFESAKFKTPADELAITKDQHFRIYLRADVDDKNEILFGLLDEQIKSTTYGIYNAESKIKIDANLEKDKIYAGNSTHLNVQTNYQVKIENSVRIYDTRYFDKKLGVKLTFFKEDENGVKKAVTGSSLLGTYFELNGTKYYPRADGTTRIKLAEKVSNASSSILISTENSSLNGEYEILVESFGSADGIYFGIEASDSATVYLDVIDNVYGLNSTLPEEQTIIDKTTGHTSEKDTGYISDTNNKLNFNLEYQSGLPNPYITVSLYRRDYDKVDDLSYTKVDLKDYVSEELEQINSEYEYIALDTETIKAKVIDETELVNFELDYTLKDKLKSGTYKVVYTLYDVEVVKKYDQIDNGDGTFTTVEREVTEYQPIGDTFSYIIIK